MLNIHTHILRLWKRQTRFFIVNVLGLSIGLAVSILLILYVFNEFSYDRYFKEKDRIIRLNSIVNDNGNQEFMPICLRKAYTELPLEVAGIDNALQIYRGWNIEISNGENKYQDVQLLYADTSFFTFFDLKPVYGNPSKTLTIPYSAILTQSQASKIFGPGDPTGKTFKVDTVLYTVGAVIADVPANTHFSFDVMFPMSSEQDLIHLDGLEFFTYYLLQANSNHEATISSINKTYGEYLKTRFSEYSISLTSKTEYLTDLHLYSKADYDLSPKGNIKTVLFLATLALLILILAIANFINLFLVQGETRSAEIGIRKVNGAGNKTIILQFFGESASLVVLAFIIGFFLVALLLPVFTSLIGHTIEDSLLYSPIFILCMVSLILVVIFLSGFYPAMYLGKLNPVSIMGGANKSFRKQRVITGVVTFQSVITIFLVSVLFIMSKQIHYLKNIPLGYEPDNVMVIYYPSETIKKQYSTLKDKLSQLPDVKSVGAGQHIIGQGMSGQGLYRYGASPDSRMTVNEYRVLPGTCETFGLQLKEGRFFREGDNEQTSIILNEKAVRQLGLKNPIGEKVVMFDFPMEIIGVVKDFFYETTAQDIQPLAFTSYRNTFNFLFVKFRKGTDSKQALAETSKVLNGIDKDYVMNAQWSDDLNASKYRSEELLSKTVTWGTFLSVIIAMLGLYAIHSYQILQKTKEIGVRKVLGSSVTEIVLLTTAKSLKWIAVAAILGLPLAYYVSGLWLQNYANHIHPGFYIFFIPVVLQAVLAFLVTSGESLRSAYQNPVKSLRYE